MRRRRAFQDGGRERTRRNILFSVFHRSTSETQSVARSAGLRDARSVAAAISEILKAETGVFRPPEMCRNGLPLRQRRQRRPRTGRGRGWGRAEGGGRRERDREYYGWRVGRRELSWRRGWEGHGVSKTNVAVESEGIVAESIM